MHLLFLLFSPSSPPSAPSPFARLGVSGITYIRRRRREGGGELPEERELAGEQNYFEYESRRVAWLACGRCMPSSLFTYPHTQHEVA